MDSPSSGMGSPHFQALFEATPDPYLILAPDAPRYTILAVNDAYLRATMTRRDGPKGIVGLGLFEAFPDPPEEPSATGTRNLRASIERAVANRAPDSLAIQRYDIRSSDGSWEERYWALRNIPVLGPGEDVVQLIHHVEDVTAQVRTEATLQVREEHYRTLIEDVMATVGAGIFILDPAYHVVWVSRAAEEFFGIPRDELLGQNKRRLIRDCYGDIIEDPERFTEKVLGAYEHNVGVEEFECHVLPGSRREDRWLVHWSNPIRSGPYAGGRVEHYYDITARKRAEQERESLLRDLETERTRLTSVFEQAPVAIAVTVGPDHTIRSVNAAYVRIFGQRDYLGNRSREVLPEAEAQGFLPLMDQVYHTGEPYVGTEAHLEWDRGGDGTLTKGTFNLVYQPLKDAEGSVWGILTFAVDVTAQAVARAEVEDRVAELKTARAVAESAQERAERAQAEAEASNRAKSDFLAAMSHEIRTPINAIIGYTDLLDLGIAGPVTEAQKSQLERVRASSQHLLGLINDILDLAKVEAGRMDVAHERALAVNAIAAALALVRPQASERGIEIQDPCLDHEGPAYVGDEDRVRQILVNLLSNAVKFTQSGGRIRITCGTTHEVEGGDVTEEGPWTYVRVQDTGVGISPEKHETVFHPFVQAEAGHTRTSGGTGLGLTISRQLARLMGGDLTLESVPGVGSTFTLWLPSETAFVPALEEAILQEVGAAEARRHGLGKVGEAIRDESDAVLKAFARRLRVDPQVPNASGTGRANLEDHTSTFLADIAQSLITIEESEYDTTDLLRDGSEIQRLISRLHGIQRARLGWTEEAVRREFQILREEVEKAVRRKVPAHVETGQALELFGRFLEYAERISRRSLRHALLIETS